MTFTGPPPVARYAQPPSQASPIPPPASPAPPVTNGRIPQVDGPSSGFQIPQVDGPSSASSSSGADTPPPATYAPRGAAHPSLPKPQPKADEADGDEAINSDLDDSDSDAEREEGAGTSAEQDIVFCTYDKVSTHIFVLDGDRILAQQVARVKNKWKCILKDGMIHVNGKDYLFAKCTG